MVDRGGEALGIASDLINEGHVLGDSQELGSTLEGVKAHLWGGGRGAAGNGGPALEAEAGHARRSERIRGGRKEEHRTAQHQ